MNKQLWSFWQNDPSNTNESDISLLADCIASFTKFCPGWTIRILNSSNYRDWVPAHLLPKNFDAFTPTFQSDFIRLILLYVHGGLWVDATYEFLEDIKWLEDFVAPRGPGCYGFFYHQTYPESHFLYCGTPDSATIKLWLDTLIEIAAYSPDFSKSPVYQTPGVLQQITEPNYFMIYAAYLDLIYHSQSSGFVKVIALPEVFEFYVSTKVFPNIPGTGRHALLSPRQLLGKKTKVVKYAKTCRNFLRHKNIVFVAWILVFLVAAGIIYFVWKPAAPIFIIILASLLFLSGLALTIFQRLIYIWF